MSAFCQETTYGFQFGAALVERACSDDNRGWVVMTLCTPKHAGIDRLQIYVTRTGKVRISDARGEWKAPKAVGRGKS
jgi:hypothetical protein